MSEQIYRKLQQHLDRQPIGFPKAKSGVEIKILQHIFTADQARIALAMSYHHETSTQILERMGPDSGFDLSAIDEELQKMARAGAVFYKEINTKEREYALIPFVFGMYEFQINRLNKNLLSNVSNYFKEEYAFEYLIPHKPQFRILPVQKSVQVKNHIATYESLTNLIKETKDPIAVMSCFCKTSKDMIEKPCKKTTRRDVCLTFRDIARYVTNEKMGYEITKEAALAIAKQSEEDGLILEASGEQEVQAVCACCSCCCGVVKVLNSIKRPVDYVQSNYSAKINEESCIHCGACVKKCNMNAITIDAQTKTAKIAESRCIGCGICVAACKKGAIELVDKTEKMIPPLNTKELLECNMQHKKGKLGRALAAVKIATGIKK